MRRSAHVSIGPGEYSKPPLAPLGHVAGSRARMHTPDTNGLLSKDRFGPCRERSPSISNMAPRSHSQPNSREKSPNPTSQDLQDCSMCLSAYIQSLNTVCGTACRLAQCLSQVASDSSDPGWPPFQNFGQGTNNQGGYNGNSPISRGQVGYQCGSPNLTNDKVGGANNFTSYNSGNSAPPTTNFSFNVPNTQQNLAKDAAEIWESIARSIGVASAAVKTQMLIILQEAQYKNVGVGEGIQKQEVGKVVQAMLSTFLSLHCQFSFAVIEKFGPMLTILKPEFGMFQSSLNMTPNSVPPGSGPSSPLYSFKQPTSPAQTFQSFQQMPYNQQQQLAQQQFLLQQQQQISGAKMNDFLQPQNDGRFADLSNDPLFRRWSMGGLAIPVAENASVPKHTSLAPVNLPANNSNRRWSVPEASQHNTVNTQTKFDSMEASGNQNPQSYNIDPIFRGSFVASNPIHRTHVNEYPLLNYSNAGMNCIPGYGLELSPIPRGYRGWKNHPSGKCSPSNSRSVTPEQNCTTGSNTNNDLHEIVNILSMSSPFDKSQPPSSPSYQAHPPIVGASGRPHPTIPTIAEFSQSIKDSESLQQAPFDHAQNQSTVPVCYQNQCTVPVGYSIRQADPCSNLKFDINNAKYSNKSISSVSPNVNNGPVIYAQNPRVHFQPNEKYGTADDNNSIGTPLWPPTEKVPEVTLTECSGDEEKTICSSLTDDFSQERYMQFANRDNPNRSSWPNACFQGWENTSESDLTNNTMSEWPPVGATPPLRRHSTDAPYFLHHPVVNSKTRSVENLNKTSASDSPSKTSEGCLDANIQRLLYISSLSPTESPKTSQYSLFTSSSR